MFTVSISGYFISDYEKESKLRIARSYEIELCATSNAVSIIDDQAYNHITGSIIVFKPGQRRTIINNFESHFIHIRCSDPDFRRKYLDTLPTQIFNIDSYKFTQYMKELYFIYQELGEEISEEEQLLLDAKITAMIIELNRIARTQVVSNETSKYVSNVTAACRYISKHFREPIGIEEIAQAAMLSPSFTYVIFKKVTGVTPHAFLKNARIHYACEQLLYTSKNVAQISLECGFSSEYYLNQIFAKHTGMTPGQYRQNYRRKLE